MKNKYYIDLTLLIIMLILSAFTIIRIDNPTYIVIFIAFLVLSVYVNFKFRIVLKYPYEGKSSIGEDMGFFLVLLGKIAYIMGLVNVVFVNPHENLDFIVYTLVVFMLDALIFKGTSYVYKNKLIYNFSKVVDFEDIKTYEVREEFLNIFYLTVYLQNNEIFKLRLSASSYRGYQKFNSNIH